MACYRIALTGAQGTGKSTLARAIHAQLEAYRLPDVVAYWGLGDGVAGDGNATGERADAAVVRAFAERHRRREADGRGAIQVFDRCLLDTLAYADVLGCFDAAERRSLAVDVERSCAAIDNLVWMRVTEDYPVTAPADESPRFRRAIDQAIGRIAQELGLTLESHAVPAAHWPAVAIAIATRCRNAIGAGGNRR